MYRLSESMSLHLTSIGSKMKKPLSTGDVVCAELWERNPAGRTQYDGSTEIADRDLTLDNKARAETFIEHVIKTPSPRFEQYMSPRLIQHSPDMHDGLAGMTSYLRQPDAPLPMLDMIQGNPIDPATARAQEREPVHYDKLHFSIAEGNFVLTVFRRAASATRARRSTTCCVSKTA